MALTQLSNVQKATVVALVEARRLDAVPADGARASSFMHQAAERLGQLPLLTSPAVRYGIAYDAAHDIGEALLAAYGYHTANGPGQHEALGRYFAHRDRQASCRQSGAAVRPSSAGTQPGPLPSQAGRCCRS